MAADEQKIFEQTILSTISQISADRDEIAAGLNAKGLNIQVGSTLSEIAFTASDTSDDSAIKASPTQFGQVKILSDDSSVGTYQLSSPVVFNAKYVNDELTNINNSITVINGNINTINSNINYLSGGLSTVISTTIPNLDNRVSTIETTISNETSGLIKKVNDLNTNKSAVKIAKGLNDNPSNTETQFIVRKVSPEEYLQKLSENTNIPDNELYVISSADLIAFNNPIKYVGNGVLSNDATTVHQLSSVSAAITSNVDTLNSTVETLSTDLSTAISNVICADIPNLNSSVVAKASIEIGESLTADLKSTDVLKIRKVSPEEYAELLATQKDTDLILSNEMYIISADYLIGFDNKIVDVADGTESTDAATFGQLSALSVQVNELKGIVETLSIQLAQLTPAP